jgi:hypothetical protein
MDVGLSVSARLRAVLVWSRKSVSGLCHQYKIYALNMETVMKMESQPPHEKVPIEVMNDLI